MSEQDKTEVKTGEKNDLIDTHVSLILAENSSLKAVIAEKDELIASLSKKLQQATDILEETTKSQLLVDLKDKTTIPGKFLQNKTVEELTKMKEVLDYAAIPAFKSGTPVYVKEEDQATKLGKVFDDFAARTWRKNQ